MKSTTKQIYELQNTAKKNVKLFDKHNFCFMTFAYINCVSMLDFAIRITFKSVFLKLIDLDKNKLIFLIWEYVSISYQILPNNRTMKWISYIRIHYRKKIEDET